MREAGSGGRLLSVLAANVPPEEARLEWFDPEDLRLATGAVDSLPPRNELADLTPQEVERRQGLWWYLLAAAVLATPLAGYGKKGNLEPPPGEESLYPRHYPAPEPYPTPDEPEAQ